MNRSTTGTAKLKVILAMLIFGTVGIFVRWIPLPASIIANVRGIGGTLFLLAVAALRRQTLHWDAIRANLKLLIPCGIMLGFNWIALFEAFRYTTVAVATVCYYLAPVFVLLLSPLLLGEKLTLSRCMCAGVALLGIVLTSGVIQGGGQWSFTGVALALLSALTYAAIVLLSKKLSGLSGYETTIMELGISALVLLPYNLLTVDFAAMELSVLPLLLLAVVSIVHTGIAYSLYFGAIPFLPAQTAAVLSYIDPVVAILLSALLLREPLDLLSGIGAVLVLGSTLGRELLEGRKAKRAAVTTQES